MANYLPISERYPEYTFIVLRDMFQNAWGDGLSVDQSVKLLAQFNDGVFLTQEEYDELIAEPVRLAQELEQVTQERNDALGETDKLKDDVEALEGTVAVLREFMERTQAAEAKVRPGRKPAPQVVNDLSAADD